MNESEIAPLLRGKVIAFTGAGLSVPSGLPTFWGSGGMYEGMSAYDLASPEGFERDPERVWRWYKERLRGGCAAKPNAGHLALARLEQVSESLTIITSNVDDLHARAGSKAVYRLHGNILETSCMHCFRVSAISDCEIDSEMIPMCECGGILRPNVVWFGERPWQDAIEAAIAGLQECDVALEIGHSGVVSYGFTEWAVRLGKPVVRINPDESAREVGVLHIKESADTSLHRLVAIVA